MTDDKKLILVSESKQTSDENLSSASASHAALASNCGLGMPHTLHKYESGTCTHTHHTERPKSKASNYYRKYKRKKPNLCHATRQTNIVVAKYKTFRSFTRLVPPFKGRATSQNPRSICARGVLLTPKPSRSQLQSVLCSPTHTHGLSSLRSSHRRRVFNIKLSSGGRGCRATVLLSQGWGGAPRHRLHVSPQAGPCANEART